MLAVDGPDDLCAPLLGDPGAHCRGESVSVRDDRARASIGEHLTIDAAPGRRFRVETSTLPACAGCEWADLCSRVAEDGYRDTVLR